MKYSGPSGDPRPRVTHSERVDDRVLGVLCDFIRISSTDLSKRIEFLFPFVSLK